MEKIVNMSQLEDRKKSKPQNIGYKSVKWIVFVIFTFYALTLVIPFVWMLLNSVKSDADFTKNIWGLPEVFEGKNFIFNSCKLFSSRYSWCLISDGVE